MALGHDAKGNVTNDSMSGLTYSYSSENLMTGVSAGWNGFLRYDPLMRLYEGGMNSTTRWGYDGDEIIAEYTSSGALESRYVHGPGAEEPLVAYNSAGTAHSFRPTSAARSSRRPTAPAT